MGLTNKLGVLGLIVIALGVLVRLNPEVLLKLPLGFLLYHLAAGAPIPGYIVTEHWSNDSWLKAGDVVVSAAPKSGTTWSMATAHLIRTKGEDDFDQLLDVVPWAGFVRYPGETLSERTKYFERAAAPYTHAIYKSHANPNEFVIRKDVKYIVGLRDFVDAMASFNSFLPSHTKVFADTWGGFPPRDQTPEQFEHMFLHDKGDGKGLSMMIIDHIKGWWPHRNDPNVLVLHYGDRIKDAAGYIARWDKFLGAQLTSEQKQIVQEKSHFNYMKKHNFKFSYCLGVVDTVQQLKDKVPKGFCAMEPEGFVAKGKDRDGRKEMSPELVGQAHILCATHLGKTICDWLKTGGPMPEVEIP